VAPRGDRRPHPPERVLIRPRTEFQVFEPLRYGQSLPSGTSSSSPKMTSSRPLRPRWPFAASPRSLRGTPRWCARRSPARRSVAGVREAATLALRDALVAGDVPPDVVLARLVHDPRERVRRAAASVLAFAAAEREDVVSRLARLLENGDGFCKEYAARALERAGAVPALADALDSEDAGVRTWAAAALLRPSVVPSSGSSPASIPTRIAPTRSKSKARHPRRERRRPCMRAPSRSSSLPSTRGSRAAAAVGASDGIPLVLVPRCHEAITIAARIRRTRSA